MIPRPPTVHCPTTCGSGLACQAGDSVPVVSSGAKGAGRYAVALTPLPGVRYRLTGTIIDSTISAFSMVPSLLRFDSPHNGDTAMVVVDTLDSSADTSFVFQASVTAPGAFGYIISLHFAGVPSAPLQDGDLVTAPPSLRVAFPSDTTITYVYFRTEALDPGAFVFFHSAGHLSPFDPLQFNSPAFATTLQGAGGFFGSAVADSVLVYRPR